MQGAAAAALNAAQRVKAGLRQVTNHIMRGGFVRH
jgi:hypothetical protein